MRPEKINGAQIITLLIMLSVVPVRAVTITEDFASNPNANGWRIFGNPNLFHWDSTNENLRVTWDSSKTNSYFYLPLGTILSRDDDFELSFDLTFDDYASGATSNKPFAAAAAIGFLDLDQATLTNFSRGAGVNATYGPRNLFEFDFFPPFASFLPTIAQTIVSTNNAWLYNHDNLAEMTPGATFRVAMTYDGATRTLLTTVTNNSGQYGDTQTIIVPTNFDFRVATFSISSYSDVRDIGSILAHGTVDNITITTPPPPVENFSGAFNGDVWQAQFMSRSNWVYSLERTANFDLWAAATGSMTGNGGMLILQDTNPPTGMACYRVRANRP
ncbi:MAG: hypothetical protein HOP33_01700 [Verrucomicrobia bacterium]|nr:hypothetical protein [Verrucomicrobiota bacterium]